MWKKISPLDKEGYQKTKEIIELLKSKEIQSPEEWILQDSDSFMVAHRLKVTEIILCQLGIKGYRDIRVGGTRVFKNINVDIFVNPYIKNNCKNCNDLYKVYPGPFSLRDGYFHKRLKDHLWKVFAEKYSHISDDQIFQSLLDEGITDPKNLSNGIYVTLIKMRGLLRARIHKHYVKTFKKNHSVKIKIAKEHYYATYPKVSSENIKDYILKNDIKNRSDLNKKNPYLQKLIFHPDCIHHFHHLVKEGIFKEGDGKPLDMRIVQLSVREIADCLYQKVVDKSLSPRLALKKIDSQLADRLSHDHVAWVVKYYILIRLGLLFTLQTEPMWNWDEEKVCKFLSTLGLNADSELLPKFKDYLETKRIFL